MTIAHFAHFAHCSNPRLSSSFWRWSRHRKMADPKNERGQWRERWGTCVSFSAGTTSRLPHNFTRENSALHKSSSSSSSSDSSSSSSSNWILMCCQPHRVTSGQSNSGHKQIHTSKLFSHTYQPSVKSVDKTSHFANIKHTHKHQTQIRSASPFNITHVKRAHKARTCWYRRPSRLIYRYQAKEKYEKGMDTHNIKLKKILYKCIMANTSAISLIVYVDVKHHVY